KYQVAVMARQYFAEEIFDRLRLATGLGVPLPSDPDRWQAARALAQIAANLVDFVDDDDTMTRFEWAPGEWVYGTELPRVVLYEAYVEYVNLPDDLASGAAKVGRLKANVWVELHNPFRDDAPLATRGGRAVLDGAYQLWILRNPIDRIRDPQNVE